MRPLAVAAIADVALVALAFRRSWWLLGASGLAVAIVAVAVLAIGRRATPTYPVSDHALISSQQSTRLTVGNFTDPIPVTVGGTRVRCCFIF